MSVNSKAVVILSGGQDSVTCLGVALNTYETVEAIAFTYGQKHSIEIAQAKIICDLLDVKLTIHEIPSLEILGDSALTTNGNVDKAHHRDASLPASFVPNRNALFITIAHAFAQKVGAGTLLTGVCQTDYSGYPDCRKVFITSLQHVLNLGYNTTIKIVTPLMNLTKAETFELAEKHNILATVINYSHTCYNGERDIMHPWGAGCGTCGACKLRAKGWDEYQETKRTQA